MITAAQCANITGDSTPYYCRSGAVEATIPAATEGNPEEPIKGSLRLKLDCMA